MFWFRNSSNQIFIPLLSLDFYLGFLHSQNMYWLFFPIPNNRAWSVDYSLEWFHWALFIMTIFHLIITHLTPRKLYYSPTPTLSEAPTLLVTTVYAAGHSWWIQGLELHPRSGPARLPSGVKFIGAQPLVPNKRKMAPPCGQRCQRTHKSFSLFSSIEIKGCVGMLSSHLQNVILRNSSNWRVLFLHMKPERSSLVDFFS